jgi:hypothetical protein
MKDFHVIKDFAIIASITSAFLYVLGYINETVYLEGFQLNNSELAPDIATSITLGFRYLFLNVFGAIVIVTLLGPVLLMFLSRFQGNFFVVLANSNFLTSLYRDFLQAVKWEKIKYFIFIFVPGVMVLSCIHAGNKAASQAQEFKAEIHDKIEIAKIYEGNDLSIYSGKVIRIRDNMVLFWSIKDGVSYIFSQKNIISISYLKSKEFNESSQNDVSQADTSA